MPENKVIIFVKNKENENLIKPLLGVPINQVLIISEEQALKDAIAKENVSIILSDTNLESESIIPFFVIINRMKENLDKLEKLTGEKIA